MEKIKSSADVYGIVSEPLSGQVQENAGIITLNNANEVIGLHWMFKGSDTSVVMSTKLIARQAVMDVACGVVLVHNHPSGNVRPSRADIRETERLKGALDVFEMSLVDHVIVSDGKWYSFADEEEHSI